jgi:hypothetical protein
MRQLLTRRIEEQSKPLEEIRWTVFDEQHLLKRAVLEALLHE